MKELYRRFKEWQQEPHQVAPLSPEQHECATCGTHYEGNYCPRCGQSSRIGRYSFKNAILLYLDVWGMGNRGMFRTIRDLILRPGYMIRDYLKGMQMAYYPPFNLFFLLIALSLLVDTGLNIRGINRQKEAEELYEAQNKGQQAETQEEEADAKFNTKLFSVKVTQENAKDKAYQRADQFVEWCDQHSSAVILAALLLFSIPLYLMFHHCPAVNDLRLSECFVAMVYITDMLIIYNLVPSLLCFSPSAEKTYILLSLLLIIIPIKQLSGYSYWSTAWRLVLITIFFVIAVFLLLVGIVFGIVEIVKYIDMR
jgi:hypothetical protein